MASFAVTRAFVVGLAATLVANPPLPASASGETDRMLGYLTGASTETAADYLAFLIRVFGCEVRRDQRNAFNEVVLDQLAFEFGVRLAQGSDGARIVPETLNEALFAFSYRAGPHLVERGELSVDRDGTARLLNCGALLS